MIGEIRWQFRMNIGHARLKDRSKFSGLSRGVIGNVVNGYPHFISKTDILSLKPFFFSCGRDASAFE